uniref:Integrator complex subunit 1 n=1 Tax=Astatotilapia calliptera TaxID=8154 RepID=A0AAX7UUE0_ASTCA
MNRPKPTTLRRPSAAKPSGHPPTGDFIALGSKSQGGEPKAPAVLLKATSTNLPADRKRETSSTLPSSSGLANLTKRPKLSTTPPVSALGRLADVAAVDKRAISPSIKEPSVVPIEVSPAVLLDEIEAAESEGNDDRIEGLLCGAVKQLKMNRAKPDITLYLSLMFLAKIKPNVFATEGIIEALCSLLRRDASINFKAKGNSLVSVLACNLLMAAYEEDENWPEIFVKVYIEDSLGERIWVDSSHCKNFVDNIQTAFGTKMPPKSMLLQADTGRSAGDLSAGSSPHPSTPDEDDSQTELLIAEEKLSPEDEGQVMPRYDELAESVEDYVLDVLRDQLNRRQPMDNVSRNLLRLLTATCGYKEARLMAVQRLEMWLQNPKVKPLILTAVYSYCNTLKVDDMEVISNLIKIRLKPKVLLNHYMLCVRELLNAHRDNLGTMVKLVIFNELSNARNPNNMQVLHTVLQHSPEQAPKFLAMVFQDLLTNKDDYLRASRALLREIIKQTKHEINFQSFCFGLMQERKEASYVDMEFKERFVIQVTDLLTVSMMLGITAQVKEAGIAWDKGEKKNLEVLRSFQNQIAAIQRDAVWWLHTVVPTISKLGAKDYVHCLHKVLFTEQPETYYKWDNWPPESDRNFFLRLCSEVPLLEDTLMRILVIGLSRDLPLGPADAMELADHLVKRAAGVQSDDLEVLRVERIQLIDAVLNLCTYHHPENIQLPAGYQPPNLAISTLYWKAWLLLLVVAAFNPQKIGLAAWDGYPTLKMLMEMVMTNNYTYPPCTIADEDTKTEMINRELQISQREKQEILAFESHLAAASTKQTITESNSLLLSQLTSLDPQGPPRRPPPQVQEQVKSLNQSLRLGHLLCRSRNPDFLLNIIQRQASSQSMPWLADLVQSSEGSLDVLPVQCLCEFLLHDAADDSLLIDDDEEGESKEQKAKKRQRQQKQRQLLGRLQDLLLGPKADEQTTCEVLDYFLRRLSSSQVASRVLAMKGLSLVLTEGGLKDGEERDQPMEEDSADAELLPGYQWLLQDLPKLPLFDSVRGMTSTALQQAIHMETDPQTISAYLIYLSQHAPVEEQASHNDLALDIARLIVERSTIMNNLFSKHSSRPESDAVLYAFLSIFSTYIKRMRKTKEGEDLYSWSESQDQVFLRWTTGETATMHILVVHAIVILLTLGPPKGSPSDFHMLLDIWFPDKKPLPTAFLVDTSEEALLLPDWLKLRMIRSEVSRLVDAALQDLEAQQLLLFVQSFGIPVSSMSKLLQYLDQAVSHDPQALEQNIMDKHYMAHLVEVQHERGATGGHTFHSLLSSSLPPHRDSSETSKAKVTVETPHSSVKMRAATQLPVVGPDDDLTGMLLQIFPLKVDPRWHGPPPSQVSLALQQALAKELMRAKQGQIQQGGLAFRLLQAIAALLASAHAGPIVISMHRSHSLSCPLMRQLHLYQRLVSQDIAFSSLFLKVIVEMLIWLDNPTVEAGPLKTLLRSFAGQNSHKHRLSDVRTGFLHLAEALAYRRDTEVPLRAIIAMLKTGEKCNAEPELVGKVLQGLMEVKSPYLEELLSLLMTVGTQNGTAGSVAMVISLLLQESEERAVKKEVDSNNGSEVTKSGLSSGLLVDWLERLDPEVTSVCPDLQQKLLFRRCLLGTPAYRPYLLALLTHQSNWSTLLQCISALLSKRRDYKLDPSSALDFLWACSHIPRIWQGRDQKIPQKKTEKFVLRLSSEELISLMDLILSESELNSHDTLQDDKNSVDQAPCSLIQSRLPLLHSYCLYYLKICCIYRQRLLCFFIFLGFFFFRLIFSLSILNSKSAESRVSDANLACRKLAVSHPVLLLRHLPMIAGLLHGRMHLNMQEFRQQNHMTFFSNVLAILELLQPLVFHSDHQRALQDCLLSFMKVLQNFQRTRSPLVFINKFLQFTQKYITHDGAAAIPYLQKHSDILHLCAENPDLVQLKSLLAGLTLPVKSSSAEVSTEERDGKNDLAAGSLPLVNISASFLLSAADMTMYLKKMSKGEAVEDVLEVLTEVDEKSRRSPEIIQYFINDLQRLMTSPEELCRNMAFSLALRCIQNNPCLATDFLPTFMYCMGSGNFDVVQTALRNLPEYVLLCQEHADILLYKAFLVGIYGQIDTSSMISESMKVLHMEATT